MWTAFRFLTVLVCVSVIARGDENEVVAREITFFVSTTGSDENIGTQANPFRTLVRAQTEVRSQIAHGLSSPIQVFLDGGVYELEETLTFGPQDSGTRQHAVCYAALPGEAVILSGGQSIRDWKIDPDGMWTAQLPNVKSGDWFFRQLVVNDGRATRARWPNADDELHLATVNTEVTEFGLDLPTGKDLAGQDTELVVYQNWSVTRGLVSHSNDKRLTTATPMGWIGHGPATTASPGKPVFLEHALRFVDQPGEWFLDRSTGVLHYQPINKSITENADPRETEIVAPRLHQILVIAGTPDTPVRNLHFEGIRFEHSDFALPKIGYNEIQAAHYGTTLQAPTFVQPTAIECTHAEACRFHNCRFAHLNSSGIGLGIGCRNNKIDHCTIENIGGNGVMIGWRGKGELRNGAEGKLDADWQDPDDAPWDNTVSNCLIRKCGADSFGGTAIWIAFSRGTRITHNQIHDLPYTGISVGYRWNTTPTSQRDCLVESNHIFDVMKKLADGGGIYTLGFQAGTIFRGNHIHDVHRSPFAHGGAPNNGFFVDEGSKGFLFESNVVDRTSGEPVRFNNCQQDWHTWNSNHFGEDAARTESAQAIIEQAGVNRDESSRYEQAPDRSTPASNPRFEAPKS